MDAKCPVEPATPRARPSLARTLLLAAASLAGCAEESTAPSAVSGAPDGPAKPSVILVSIDTLRADHVGLYGYERDTTPFLDRWSKDATVFEQAYTTAAWTLVAHMTMLTGLFPEQHDVIGKQRALSPEIPLLAERLRSAGYRTVALYTPGWIDARYGFQRGFDLFQPHADLAQADAHLRAILPELADGPPFFLFLHLFDVHCGPFAKDKNSVYPAPSPYEHMFVEQRMQALPDEPAEKFWWSRGVLGPDVFETAAAMYDGGIRQVDDQLAQWFGELERRGLFARALTIVTSDHGEALGQRGIFDRHGDYYQEALHVPLIVRHPAGLLAGKRVAAPVHLGDLVPTILASCGLPIDAWLPGRALFGPLPERRVIYGIKLPHAFVLDGARKLVLGPKKSCLLLDLEQDPRELAPLPGDPQEFQKLCAEALAPGKTFPHATHIGAPTAADQDALEALGYGGEDDEADDKGPPNGDWKKPSAPPEQHEARGE